LLQLLSSDDISPVTVGATSDRTHLAEHSQRQNALRDALGGSRLSESNWWPSHYERLARQFAPRFRLHLCPWSLLFGSPGVHAFRRRTAQKV